MPVNIGVNIQRSPNRINQQLREAGVEGKFPKLLLDFKDQYYLASGGSKTLANAVTHARSGNATMTDGYGPELLTNGAFSSTSTADWTTESGASLEVVDQRLLVTLSGAGSRLETVAQLETGKTYVIDFSFERISGEVQFYFDGAFVGPRIDSSNTKGTGSFVVQGADTELHFREYGTGNAFTGYLDNVSVREMPVLKWAPHNLLPTLDNFSNTAADTNVTSGQSDPDGGTDAFEIDITSASGDINHGVSVTSGVQYSIDFIIKPDSTASSWIRVNVASVSSWFEWDNDWAEGTTGTGFVSIASENLGSGWYKVKVTATAQSTGTLFFGAYHASADGNTSESISTTYLYQIHAYRSDLGGMADNPERGDSYVPTTSAAKYLPRIGHHVYNGSAWVNEGVLAESESRTNLLTQSNAFTSSPWLASNSSILASSVITPDGTDDSFKLNDNTVNDEHSRYMSYTYTTGLVYTLSIFAKKEELDFLTLGTLNNASQLSIFNLDTGVVDTIASDHDTATIEDVGNGWFRCSTTFTKSASINSFAIFGVSNASGTVTYAGDGSSGIYVYGAMLEQAATLSSYTPTAGSSVTRAAETFTIPSANLPWPTPQYIGDNIVTNGTFDTDSDWTKGTGWSISGGQATHVAGTGSNLQQSVAYGSSGTIYALSVDVVSISGGSGSIQARSGGATTAKTIDGNTSGTTVTLIYVHDGLNTDVAIYAGSGTSLTVDNISVREINPLSVSIAMDGRVTYADTDTVVAYDGQSGEVVPYSWREGTTAFVSSQLATDSTRTGRMFFNQRDSVAADTVFTAEDYYSPDVLVPFDIAGRHGSTFINGATEGVALTANTTPTALADLSSTDMRIAFIYMGTVGTFRVWDRDITDTGLVEATNPSLEPSLSLTFEGTGTNSFVVNDWSE